MSSVHFTNALGLDLGTKKIGVARANSIARIPEPLVTLKNDDSLIRSLLNLVHEYAIDLLVVGLPRNLNGQETEQSKYTQELASMIAKELALPTLFQDETLSTQSALAYSSRTGSKASEDAIAACVILEDFLSDQQNYSDKI